MPRKKVKDSDEGLVIIVEPKKVKGVRKPRKSKEKVSEESAPTPEVVLLDSWDRINWSELEGVNFKSEPIPIKIFTLDSKVIHDVKESECMKSCDKILVAGCGKYYCYEYSMCEKKYHKGVEVYGV